jgi:hypothetical protein
MNRSRRNVFFIDQEVQGALMLRVGYYWLFCLLGIVLMVICWNVYVGPPRSFAQLLVELYHRHAPALASSLLLLPIVMMDVLRMSHRFVGPIVRLRGALRGLAEGRPAQPLNFRDGDFWRDLATDFNQATARLSRDSAELARQTEMNPELLAGGEEVQIGGEDLHVTATQS